VKEMLVIRPRGKLTQNQNEISTHQFNPGFSRSVPNC